MSAVELITQAEYARRRGVAKSAVARAVKEGRIVLIDGKIDPAIADIQWERNTRSRADSGRAAFGDGEGGAGASAAPAPAPRLDDGYYEQRARRERLEADLAALKLGELQGELVRVADVRTEMGTRLGQVRSNLLQIPARMAPLLANESDQAKIHALLDKELRAVLTSLVTGPHEHD